MFTPVPLYVAGIVYAIHRRVCCRCCCPNETELAEKEAQKQERREKRALRRQAREQKKLKKKKKKIEGKGGSFDTHGPEEIPLKPVASTEIYIAGNSDSSNNGITLVNAPVSDVNEKHEVNQQSTALGANVKNDNQFKVDF